MPLSLILAHVTTWLLLLNLAIGLYFLARVVWDLR